MSDGKDWGISVSGSGGPWETTTVGTISAKPAVTDKGEEPTVGIRLLKDELERRAKVLAEAEREERQAISELARARREARTQRDEVKVLEKELELLEGYARMKEAGEVV